MGYPPESVEEEEEAGVEVVLRIRVSTSTKDVRLVTASNTTVAASKELLKVGRSRIPGLGTLN